MLIHNKGLFKCHNAYESFIDFLGNSNPYFTDLFCSGLTTRKKKRENTPIVTSISARVLPLDMIIYHLVLFAIIC